MSIEYTPQIIEKATQFYQNLQSFTNKDIKEINDGKPCNDKIRNEVIIELIAEEFGDEIFKHLRFKY